MPKGDPLNADSKAAGDYGVCGMFATALSS